MKILVTGANGFVGKNLISYLENKGEHEILKFDIDTEKSLLAVYAAECDLVFHLAGVNRPKSEDEFMKGNFGFTSELLEALKAAGNKATVVTTSSVQAALDNPYGISKKAGEDLLFEYGRQTGATVVVYRLPNVFGKWCRPNYNSAVATFCYNIARDIPIRVNEVNPLLKLVYVDDVVDELLLCIDSRMHVGEDGFGFVPEYHEVYLKEIPKLLYEFSKMGNTLEVPDFKDAFAKKLFATYLSYLPENEFAYSLNMHVDNRGSFTEFIRTPERGQVSVNISHPGIVKGNHWHRTKNEKFLVVKGKGLIELRKVGDDKIISYHVNGEELTVVQIPCGYTHSIANEGDDDMVTVMWVNEAFDPNYPDTFYEEVRKNG